jgi:transposase
MDARDIRLARYRGQAQRNPGKFVVLPKCWIVERTFAWLANRSD